MKSNFYKTLLLICFGLSLAQTGFAQSLKITGQVRSASDKLPLPGVSISIKNGAGLSTTDTQGNFSVNVPLSTVLVFNSIGFLSQLVTIKNENVLIISLSDDIAALEEVVVTGLASGIKRSNLANAVTSISSKELTGTTPPQTVDKALYGKVPGANIRANSGAPGGGISVQLRGISSLQGASQPLYIIDGVYLNNNVLRTGRSTLSAAGTQGEDDASNRLADLNANDIENIEVLKGSSASAIYGTRANAGVIIITTKRGKAGKTRISFSQDAGFSKLQKKVGAATWNEEKIRLFFPKETQDLELKRYQDALSSNGITDFEQLIYGEIPAIWSSNLSVSGGTEKTKFYVSGNLSDEGGIIKHTGFQRKSIRLNLDQKINDWINFSINSNYLNTNSDRGFTGNQNVSGTSIGYIGGYTPNYYNPRPVNGIYPDNPYSADQNPLELRDRGINNSKINRFIQAANLNLHFLQNEKANIKLAIQGGVDYLNSRSKQYLPDDIQSQKSLENPGDLVIGSEQNTNVNLQAFLIYGQQLNKFHFTTQFGGVFLQTQSNQLLNRGQGLVNRQENLKQAAVQSILSQYDQKVKDFGMVFQEEINFEDKVISTFGVRFDKSTLNGDADKFYAFPKASTAINLTKFDFWKVPVISQLKLRVAYGQTGGLASFGDTYTSLRPVVTGGLVGSVISSTAGNRDIKPERAGELELGADIGFLKNRIVLEATYYNKKVTDLIQDLKLAGASGITLKKVNAADLINKGVELSLTGVPFSSKDLSWTSRILFWKNTSKLTRLKVPAYTAGIYGPSYGTYLFKEGFSPTAIVGTPQLAPGQYTVYGDSQADFQSSWYNSISFLDGFSFSSLLDWRKGGKIMNITLYNTDNGGTTKDWNEDYNNNGIPNGRDREGKGAGVYVQDASYLKLREVAFNYTLSKKFTQRFFRNAVDQIRFGVSATNLLTISKYKGYDPEVSSFGTGATNTGSDLFNFPPSKRFLFNLRIDL
ncbi:SusC/RagA family TonB-linked outer membrane protein [Pedobacter caeni]|uniref:TonB-linked outer membrane protein, SusC/RagA family n=1 Tax=Pedobacter caeni TaxID=288992 RepID=A0A1M5F3G1_9SPHI|nr:SusC/RagA family TonB-linked outer membrane protein [Pedobacter caeni]SHF85612.1 TonB-linked outer membrane protein, SusC/RagA family [Pedobacter caeni]